MSIGSARRIAIDVSKIRKGQDCMRIMFTGIGGSGAWVMRGEQLAATRFNWRAVANATKGDLNAVDAVVVVKHISDRGLAALRKWGGPVIYDPLDFWDQRASRFCNTNPALQIESSEEARRIFAPDFERIAPDLILCPTQAMNDDLAPLGYRTATQHHHFDPRLSGSEQDDRARPRVLFHGKRGYMKAWEYAARLSCRLLGADFVMSDDPLPPPADVMLAVRGGRHGNWLSRRWKSNVKAATAQRLGLPFVAWPEEGYRETYPGAHWFTSPLQLHRAIAHALATPRPMPQTHLYSTDWAAGRLETILATVQAR
jgi:hypothetical protein